MTGRVRCTRPRTGGSASVGRRRTASVALRGRKPEPASATGVRCRRAFVTGYRRGGYQQQPGMRPAAVAAGDRTHGTGVDGRRPSATRSTRCAQPGTGEWERKPARIRASFPLSRDLRGSVSRRRTRGFRARCAATPRLIGRPQDTGPSATSAQPARRVIASGPRPTAPAPLHKSERPHWAAVADRPDALMVRPGLRRGPCRSGDTGLQWSSSSSSSA